MQIVWMGRDAMRNVIGNLTPAQIIAIAAAFCFAFAIVFRLASEDGERARKFMEERRKEDV